MTLDKYMSVILAWVVWPGLTAEIAAFSINSLQPHSPIWVAGLIGGFVFWWTIYLSIRLVTHHPKEHT